MRSNQIPSSLLFFLALIASCLGSAQTFDTVQVYFGFNESEPISLTALDSAMESLEFRERAAILGYADFVGTGDYNAELSKKRANVVAKYVLRNSGKKLQVTSIKGNGELPGRITESEEGDSLSRRVDVIIRRDAIVKTGLDERESEVLAEKLTRGEDIVLEGLNFIGGRHYPTPESGPTLERLLSAMRSSPEVRIKIIGHICCNFDGNDGYDYDAKDYHLSRNRAQFVYEYLVENGVAAERIEFKGVGSRSPLVFPEKTEADKAANRRVEIKVLKD